MSAKVYYAIEADQIVVVWPVLQEVWSLKTPLSAGLPPYEVASYMPCGYAVEGPNCTFLLQENWLKTECIDLGEF